MAGKRRRLSLSGGDYTTRSLTIAAQRCLNLYPEPVPQVEGEPTQVYDVATPGCDLYLTLPVPGTIRGMYVASNGQLFVCIDNLLYRKTSYGAAWVNIIGPLATSVGLVSMADNLIDLVLVDGTTLYYIYNLSTGAVSTDVAPGTFGPRRICYLDTYFIIDEGGNANFWVSDSASTTFNPLNFANMTGRADYVQAVAAVHRNLWVIGLNSTEVWYNAGGADFPFAVSSGVFLDFGCIAPFSIAQTQDCIFWLGRSNTGSVRVLMGKGSEIAPVSTFAIDTYLTARNDTVDYLSAVGWCYEQGGHAFYVLNFPPPVDRTFVYDLSTNLWHERAYTPDATTENRHRGNFAVAAFGVIAVGDWANENIYFLNLNSGNDNGAVQKRIRSFHHAEAGGGERVVYHLFQADMSAGGELAATVDLDWSDDAGQTFGAPVTQVLSAVGDFYTTPTWRRLGYGRSRVFRLTWTADADVVLSGAVVDVEPAAT